jgi:hypothetical protein
MSGHKPAWQSQNYKKGGGSVQKFADGGTVRDSDGSPVRSGGGELSFGDIGDTAPAKYDSIRDFVNAMRGKKKGPDESKAETARLARSGDSDMSDDRGLDGGYREERREADDDRDDGTATYKSPAKAAPKPAPKARPARPSQSKPETARPNRSATPQGFLAEQRASRDERAARRAADEARAADPNFALTGARTSKPAQARPSTPARKAGQISDIVAAADGGMIKKKKK